MFALSAARSALGRRAFSTSRASNVHVAVLGAAGACLCSVAVMPPANTGACVRGYTGGIGQPLSLLLKQNPLVTKLTLFDIRGCPGVAADISHVNTPAEVQLQAARLGWLTILTDTLLLLYYTPHSASVTLRRMMDSRRPSREPRLSSSPPVSLASPA